MRRFYIKQMDIQQMKQQITRECQGLLQDLQELTQQIALLQQEDQFQGNFAHSMKAYMEQVQRPVLYAAGEIAREFQSRIQGYENGYAPIESFQGFALPEETMGCFRNEVEELGNSFSGYHNQILNSILQVSDVVDLNSPDTGSIYAQTCRLNHTIYDFMQSISEYENRNLKTMEYLQSLVDSFASCVSQLCEMTSSRGTGYVPGYHTQISGLQDMMDCFASRDLAQTQLTPQMLNQLKHYGYSPAEIKQFYDNCENEEDLSLFLLLAEGNYEEAFQSDPLFLSASMDLFLADYAARIYLTGGVSTLQDFNNALLAANEEYVTDDYHWTISNRKEYRQIYMERLYAGTELLLDLNSCSVLEGNIAPETKERNWNLLTLASVWNAEHHIMKEISTSCDSDYPFYVTFDEVNPKLGEMQLQFLYMEQPFLGRRKSKMIPVEISLLETSDDLFTAEYLIERGELVRETENLWQSVLADGLEGAFGSVIAIALPEFAGAFGILKSLMKDPDSIDNSIRKASGVEKTPEEKAGTALLQEGLDMVQAYRRRKMELIRAIAEKDQKYQNALWGSGGAAHYGDHHSLVTGIYNPDYLETLGEWNREGITALLPELDMEAVEQILNNRFPNIKPNSLVNHMIHGFGNENILEYPMDQIAEAKTTLEQIIRLSDNRYERWNVEDAF